MSEFSLQSVLSVATATWAFGILNGWILHIFLLKRSLVGQSPTAWAKSSILRRNELCIDIFIQNCSNVPMYLVDVYSHDFEFAEIVPLFRFVEDSEFSGIQHTGQWKSVCDRGESIPPGGEKAIYLAAKSGKSLTRVKAKLVKAKGHPAPNAYRVRVVYG